MKGNSETLSRSSNGAANSSLNLFRLWEQVKYLEKAEALTRQAVGRMQDDLAEMKRQQREIRGEINAAREELTAETREISKRIEREIIFFGLAVAGVLWQIVSGKIGI